jgi:predicted ATPase/DNA-binding SARP family transcriptional activator
VVEVQVLGPVQAIVDGTVVEITSAKQRAVLAALALANGAVVPVESLLEVMWGEDLPAGARGTLQSYVSRLRQVVGAAVVELDHGGYRLNRDHATTDLARAESLVDDARSVRPVSPAAAAERLAAALGTWRGSPLGDLRGNLALLPDVVRLEELRATLVDEYHSARIDDGHAQETLPAIEAAAAAHPLREAPQLLLMHALHEAGRSHEALRVADRYRRRLLDETGLDPGPAVGRMEQRILAGETIAVRSSERHETAPRPERPVAAQRLPRAGLFVGREREVAELVQHLARERLVTVVGPGGVGKTRLVAEVVAAAQEDAPRAVVAELSSARHAEVVPLLGSALGLRNTTTLDAVAEYLSVEEALLVLDNCEHVIDEVRSVVHRLLRDCPGVTILATSRERLALAAEQLLVLSPLPTGEITAAGSAAELFVDRLQRAAPGLPVEPDVVARICTRLDGLPLALELAAGAASVLGASAILDRLDRALDLFDAPSPGARGRHESLRAVVDWSYRLLDDDAAALLGTLAVFEPGFTVDAVEAVCSSTVSDPVAALGRLVECSLVTSDRETAPGRFRLLDTVRQFAIHRRERVHASVGAAHAAYYGGMLERAAEIGPEEQEANVEARRDRDNLRSALRWLIAEGSAGEIAATSVALARLLLYRPDAELLSWLRGAATTTQVSTSPDAPRVMGAAARAAFLQGDLTLCGELGERAIGLARDDAVPDLDLARHSLAVRHLYRGEYALARQRWEEVLACEPAAAPQCDALGGIALACLYAGDRAGATRTSSDLSSLADAVESPTYRAFAGYVAGEIAISTDPADAISVLSDAVGLSVTVGAEFVTGLAGTALVSALTRAGRDVEALARFADLIELWRRSSTWPQQWTTLRLLAEVLETRAEKRTAALLLEAADRDPAAPAVTGADAVRLAKLRTRLEHGLGDEWSTVRRAATVLSRAQVVERALHAARRA